MRILRTEDIMEVEGKRSGELMLDELCGLCSEKHANGYCAECELNMCETCFQQHLKTKPCRNHMLSASMSIAEKTTREIKCEVHNETIKFYCTTHETVGCGDCVILSHRSCQIEYIKDKADRYMTDDKPEGFKNKLKQIEEEVECGIEKVKQYQDKNASCINMSLEYIHKCRQNIKKLLDEAEGKLCAEFNELHDNNASMLSRLLDSYENVKGQYVLLKEGFSEEHHHRQNAFINAVNAKPKLSVIEKTLEDIKSKTSVPNYHFQSYSDMEFDIGYLQKDDVTECKERPQECEIKPSADQPDDTKNDEEFMLTDFGGEFFSEDDLSEDSSETAKTNRSVFSYWSRSSATLSSDNELALCIMDGNKVKWKIDISGKIVLNAGNSVGSLSEICSLNIRHHENDSPVTLIKDCSRYYKMIRIEVTVIGVSNQSFVHCCSVYGLHLTGKLK